MSDSQARASATASIRALRDRTVGAVELTQHFIERIDRLDSAINAVVVRDFERALEAAARADAALARGERLPLLGLPVTFKEAFDVAGLPTTWSVPAQAHHVATADAAVVARFKAAGAVVLGKTNVPAMLGDFQTDSPLFGRTNNPWHAARSCGGSSGGAAAAIAAGFSALECGSDIGGSIRNPAHYCGVFGHKPTFGIVPMDGHELPGTFASPDMAVAGPIARSAADLALALEVMAGAGPASAWRLELPAARLASAADGCKLRGLRVAVWPDDAISPVDAEISSRVQAVAERLAAAGAVVSDRARPAFDPLQYRRTYVALVNAVTGANLEDASYEAAQRRAAAFDPGDASKAAVIARTLVLDHRAWLAHHAVRNTLRAQWRAFFEQWDVLICPIMATTAFPHDPRPFEERSVLVNQQPRPYFEQVFWASLATLAYLPATVFPSGPSSAGLPIGVQVIGPEFADQTTIACAGALGEFVAPPDPS